MSHTLDDALVWIAQHHPAHGPVEGVQSGPTGLVLRAGDVYFKAVAPVYAHEPALTQRLAQQFPARIPEVIAIDTARGWLLQRDGGVSLKAISKAENDPARWEPIAAAMAQMQRACEPLVETLSALGVPDARLHNLPDRFDALVRDPNLMCNVDHQDSIPADEHAQMRAARAEVETLSARLAACGIAETLHHDDFHAGNIMVDGARFGVIDWGESYIAHPFYTFFMLHRYAAYLFDRQLDDPALLRLRDAYLDAWSPVAPLAHLIEAYAVASRLAKLLRALTWHRLVMSLPTQDRETHRGSAEYWLRHFMGFVD